ncbi:MAG: hypothetical protein ABJN52_00640 [Litorimonas sp.]
MTRPLIQMALLIPLFCAACAQTDLPRLEAAAASLGTSQAIPALPPLPADCRKHARSGIKEGDRLDVALLKADDALTRQNARTTRCADWYEGVRG